jgi:hypothetical protein
MFEQAAGLALLAALSPTAMLIAASYLASTRPHKTVLLYLTGGVLMVTLLGTAALIAIRAGGLSGVGQHASRNGLRLALGIAALAAAVVIWRRQRRTAAEPALVRATSAPGPVSESSSMPGPGPAATPSPERASGKQKKPGVMARMTAEPRPATAFVVGVFVFGPSVSFLAAVQVVATAKASLVATVAAMVMIIVLTVLFAWLPLVAYLVAPDRTLGVLRAFNGWLHRNRRAVLTAAVAAIGVILTVQGATGLLS